MTNYKTAYRYFIPVLVAIAMQPAVAHSETLEDAIRATITTHPSIETATASSDAAFQEKSEHRSGYFPKLQVNGSTGRIYGDNATSRGLSVSRGSGYSNMWRGSVSATETIFDGFETRNRVKSAASKKKSADLNVLDVREALSYRAAQSYIDLMRARDGLALLHGHGKKVDDYLARIKQMVDDGGSDEAEHQQARDIRVILNGLIDDYEGQVRAAESNYFDMTGHASDGELSVPAVPEEFMPATLEEAIELARKQHPLVQGAAYTSQSAAYDVEAEKAPLMPEVEGELSYMKEEKRDLIGGEIEDGRAVINMNWAFETGGGQIARIKRKKFAHAEALSRVREAEKQVELGVRLAWSEYQTAQEQIANQELRQELNAKLFDTYEIQFEGGKISLLQLMQGDNQLFTTCLEKINGKYRLLIAEYALLSSMGRLQEALNLGTVVAAASVEAAVEPAAGTECTDGQCALLSQP